MFAVTVRILTPSRPETQTFGFGDEAEASLFMEKVNERFPEAAIPSDPNGVPQFVFNDALASVFRQSLGFSPSCDNSAAWLESYEINGLDTEDAVEAVG